MTPNDIEYSIKSKLNQDYNVNLDSLNEFSWLITDAVSIVLGVIAYGLAIFMSLITILDIAYIIIPAFRDKLKSSNLDNYDDGKFIKAVSKDAVKSINDANTIETGKSALQIYIGRRIITYIKTIFVLILILGGMRYFRGIVINILVNILK